jgi:hypothetical protein
MPTPIDISDSPSLNFEVIAYRGEPVFSRDAWVKDEKARGGVIVQVPDGFFHGIMAARFGDRPPFVYELPPVWLLVADGVDAATYEFLDWMDWQGIAETNYNQVKAIADIATGAGRTTSNLVASLPSLLKWAAIGLGAIAVVEVVRTIAPRKSPAG